MLGIHIDTDTLGAVCCCAAVSIVAREWSIFSFPSSLGNIRIVHTSGQAQPGEDHGVLVIVRATEQLVNELVSGAGID